MKKKLLAALLAVSMVMTLCACNSKKEETAATESTETAKVGTVSSKDYNPDDYVTIADYSGIEITVDVVNFTDEDVEKQFKDEVDYYVEYADLFDYKKMDKTVVEDGDIVNIDYVGKKDGVAFDGGTAQGHNLEIGSGSFIDGFESGLIGHSVGETTTLNLTFPEGYQNADLAGAAVTFDVTINGIFTREMPEVTDELIAKMDLGFDTIAAYKEDIKTYLQESCDETNASERETAIWDAIYALCQVNDPPQEMVDDIAVSIKKNAEMYASYYGVTMEEFVTTYMGYTMEEYEAECATSAVDTAKERLAVAAVAKKAGIKLSDEDVKASAEAEYGDYGYESADALLSNIGAGAYYDYVLTDKVYEYLATCVTIKENEPVSILAEEEEVYEEELSEEEVSEDDMIVVEGDEEFIEGEELEEEYIEEDPTEDLILQTE
ncbi:MAG: trigger factor [Lachnospiraceae bacterium]|nr:trigger factor [Lachnospiraceae bacterium]